MTSEAKKPRILIVEDSADIQELLAQILVADGYDVVCAGNGIEGLHLLESADELPSLILLDLMMPGMDGTEFRRRQKGLSRGNAVPVVVMSADSQIMAKSKDMGIVAYLKKPFLDIDSILTTVSAHRLRG